MRQIIDSEDPSEAGNNTAVKWIRLVNQCTTETVHRVTDYTLQSKAPYHLEQSYERSFSGKYKQEGDRITQLLVEY